jgi:Zn2+/Cd2+-exporting ATPase
MSRNEMASPEIMYTEIDKCIACDPTSAFPHTVRVTRIRVANLCCAGEEKIIRTSLEPVVGVEHIAVNVIGRYAVVKHCAMTCCAPADRLVEILNEKYLGASIQETAGGEDEKIETEFEVYGQQAIHVLVVSILFVIGLIVDFTMHEANHSMWIYLTSVIIGIGPILYSTGVALFIRYNLDIHVLMLMAIVGSVASEDYFDGSLVVTLFLSAECIEQIIMYRVRSAVSMSSAGTMPKHATLVDGKNVPIGDIQVDMVLAARAGEMILADGIVCKGEGVVDESALTGECIPVQKKVEALVRSGTIVQNGYLEVRVTVPSSKSTLQLLQKEVQDVQADRGNYAKIVDQFSQYWTPSILLCAIIFVTATGGSTGNWTYAVHRGLLLLVLACPCAIVISAPIPCVCAIAAAARNGVLIRGSSVVERMGLIDTVALDKTGTITRGFFKVVGRLPLSDDREDGLAAMEFAAAIEEKSSHPLANAVVSEHFGCIAEMADNPLPPVRKVQVIEGVGVGGWVEVERDWKYVVVGNERLLDDHGGSVAVSKEQKEAMDAYIKSQEGEVVTLLVAVEDELMLMICLADELRPESCHFVHSLTAMKMKVSMLTGDTERVARNVAATVGIAPNDCYFRLLPHQKLEWIRAQQHTLEAPPPAAYGESGGESDPEMGNGSLGSHGSSSSSKFSSGSLDCYTPPGSGGGSTAKYGALPTGGKKPSADDDDDDEDCGGGACCGAVHATSSSATSQQQAHKHEVCGECNAEGNEAVMSGAPLRTSETSTAAASSRASKAILGNRSSSKDKDKDKDKGKDKGKNKTTSTRTSKEGKDPSKNKENTFFSKNNNKKEDSKLRSHAERQPAYVVHHEDIMFTVDMCKCIFMILYNSPIMIYVVCFHSSLPVLL